ncbi:MAG: FMN-binding negative transcriptional regulator [Chitinophagales bacterium]|nr:FMN-binding negative transcriptional regulator [Chitinophagales bacterium]
MYIPNHFKQEDNDKTMEFMQTYNFALLISVDNELPIATHLPFVVEVQGNSMVLFSHLSKTNPQWKSFADKEVLVVFSEPHAYISPTLYTHEKNVPTWNYIAVHAYGKIQIANSNEKKLEILYKQMQNAEESYLAQFNRLEQKYVADLLDGIVAFEIQVNQLQSKAKLSQNKTAEERKNIKEHLLSTKNTVTQEIGKQM